MKISNAFSGQRLDIKNIKDVKDTNILIKKNGSVRGEFIDYLRGLVNADPTTHGLHGKS
ncbi:hypothetical protein [Burkholderia cepacia]|uniref:hypothetical protein n=1 Tax=Burkholderia cepacia TaxID=292 RepID=UPI0012D47145|nr:hypothetical protein [Burkholderia cepacia]